MKTVVCIDNLSYQKGLTINKQYDVVEEDREYYRLIGDTGLLCHYPKHFFEEKAFPLPCPFCGRPFQIEVDPEDGTARAIHESKDCPMQSNEYASIIWNSEKELITALNRRHAQVFSSQAAQDLHMRIISYARAIQDKNDEIMDLQARLQELTNAGIEFNKILFGRKSK